MNSQSKFFDIETRAIEFFFNVSHGRFIWRYVPYRLEKIIDRFGGPYVVIALATMIAVLGLILSRANGAFFLPSVLLLLPACWLMSFYGFFALVCPYILFKDVLRHTDLSRSQATVVSVIGLVSSYALVWMLV